MNNYQEEIFKAIDIIVAKKLQQIPYLYPIEVKIVSVKNNTTYIADYQGTNITVYSSGQTYSVGNMVLVMATNGKFSNKKYILGIAEK